MKIKIALTLAITLFAVASAVYSQDKTILKRADEYALALKNYQALKTRTSVVGVIEKGKAVSAKLDEMENLSDADYARLEKKMKGYTVNRNEIVFVEPDLKFFDSLVKTHGTPADIAYFALKLQIRPENIWAVYNQQQTDVTGCVLYGKGFLTKIYGKALQFKKTYPKDYAEDVDKEIEDITSEFRDGTCACGNRATVEQEYNLFIKTFPNDKITPTVKKKLLNLKKNKEFRFNCQSG